MGNIAQDTGKSTAQLARQVARQMAAEPFEILSSAKKQVVGESVVNNKQKNPDKSTGSRLDTGNPKTSSEEIKRKDLHRINELNQQIERIRKENLLKNLQRRISEGEVITLEGISDLTIEEKQVLKAQMEAVKARTQMRKDNESLKITSKPSRKFMAGIKTHLERLTKQTESRMPPSG